MPCPYHPPSFYHSNYTWRKVQVKHYFFSIVTNYMYNMNLSRICCRN
jgi:hypothetical protein